MERDSLTVQIPVKLTETLFFIDSTLQLIAQKSNMVLDILDKKLQQAKILILR